MNTRRMPFASNRFRDIEQEFHSELHDLYPEGERRSMLRLLAEEYLHWDTTAYLLHRDSTIDQSDLLKFYWAMEDLKRHRPLQHIIGHVHFCGQELEVDPAVLIPRRETEELVTLVESRCDAPQTILDLCTGSGCIALALAAHYPQARVYGVDLSPDALAVAQRNAERNRKPVRFLCHDLLLSPPPLPDSSFDLIVSNPPYVRESERTQMEPNVLDYEPSVALFVPDDDPLRFYRHIAHYASSHLSEAGLAAVEINEALGDETVSLFRKQGLDASLHKDLNDKDRFVLARRRP